MDGPRSAPLPLARRVECGDGRGHAVPHFGGRIPVRRRLMTAIEHIKAAQLARLVDEDGEPVAVELTPPLTSEQIDALQKKVGQPLPEELRSLLAFCSGIDGCLAGIDFTGSSMSFAQEEIFPNGLPIAADGCGNFWV